MSETAKIPCTIVTGFLGAGKTTLVRHLLENAGGRRLAVLVNEFGDMGFDGSFIEGCGIEGCSEDDIVELPNGCLCCTVADDFIPALNKLIEREKPPEHILIETSGLALPKPLVTAFNWPAIRSRVTVDGVVAVVDGPAVAAGAFADDPGAQAAQRVADAAVEHDNPLEEVFEDQLLCADLILLNKTDQMDGAALSRVRAEIREHLPRAVEVVETAHGKVDPAVLLGLSAAAENDLAARPSHHGEDGEDHDHDDFESVALAVDSIAAPEVLARRVEQAAETAGVLRIKGLPPSRGGRCASWCRASDGAGRAPLRPALEGGRGAGGAPRRDRPQRIRPRRRRGGACRLGAMHLLPVATFALDEGEEAVDLRQPPGDIVILSFADSDLSALAAAQARSEVGSPSLRLASLRRLRHPLSVDLYVEGTASKARFVLVRCLGGTDYWAYGLDRLSAMCRASGVKLAVLPGCDRPDPRLSARATVPAALCEWTAGRTDGLSSYS